MREANVPAGKLFTAEDMLSDEQYAARRNIVEVEDPDIGPFPMQNVVPRLSETPAGSAGPARSWASTTRRFSQRCSGWTRRTWTACASGGSSDAREVVDVGPRDGLQNEDRRSLPRSAPSCATGSRLPGIPRVEAASFVNPRRVPQMAGAEEVMAAIDRPSGTSYAGLVLNERATSGQSRPAWTRCATPSR